MCNIAGAELLACASVGLGRVRARALRVDQVGLDYCKFGEQRPLSGNKAKAHPSKTTHRQ